MRCDIAIIGGGVAGMAAAAFLSERADVVLLEAEELLGYHSSGRSAALYTESYGPGVVPRLTKASRSFFTDASPPLSSPRGVMFVGGEARRRQVEAMYATFAPTVPDLEWLDTDGIIARCDALTPSHAVVGIHEPGAMDLDISGIEAAYRTMAHGHDARILLGHRVTGISHDGAWRLATTGGDVESRVLVNASGAWGDAVARLAGVAPLGLRPLKRSAFLADPHRDPRAWPMVIDVDEEWYMKPEGPNILGSAASELPSPPMDARPDEIDIALGIERINDATTLGIRSVISTWAGLRVFTPDRIPAAGFADDAPSFFWLVGQGGYGIKTSPALGRITAGLILDGTVPADMEAAGITADQLAPSRFPPAP